MNNKISNEVASWLIAATVVAIVWLLAVGIFILDSGDAHAEVPTVVTTESIPETIIPETQETIPEAPSEPTIEETLPPVDPEALELLAIVIYREAGADSCCDECRRMVADVVLNRVESDRFPNTIYEVLTQENQYWKMWEEGVYWPESSYSVGERHAVERAYRIAEEVLRGQHSKIYGQGYIWQALFEQGNEGFYCHGTYFGRD
jgi:hypothetical protein